MGPIWQGGGNNEEGLLASCYRNCMALAREKQISGIAFPAISTGVYGFPIEKATSIAIREVSAFLSGTPEIRQVIFVCFSAGDKIIYQQTLKAHGKSY